MEEQQNDEGTAAPPATPAPPGTTPPSPADAPAAEGAREVPPAESPRLDITREEVRDANDTAIEIVPVDEWKKGAVIYVHTPSIADKDQLENVIATGKNPDGSPKKIGEDGVRAAFVAMCARNSKGERIFTGDDVEWLKKKSIAPMDRIFSAMLKVGVIVSQKDVEEIAKNSGAASNGIS